MDKKLYVAAVSGDCSILKEVSDNKEYFLRRIVEIENNVIHVAVRYEQEDFIREASSRFPELISQTNSCGETPFHFAAETGNVSILELLLTHSKGFERPETADSSGNDFPWRVKDSKGNSPLHVALVHGKIQFATMLVETDPELAASVNNSRETPLHLAIKYRVEGNWNAVLI